MLSILIPTFNQNVVRLINDLKEQCIKAKINFEIISLDDKSDESFRGKNRVINELLGVNYVELSENIGRSRIRNRLVKLARYEHVLCIDCDSRIVKKTFIKSYLQMIEKYPNKIICGGTIYGNKRPKSQSKQLHWKYGQYRESPKSVIRNKRPFELFHSNNFCAPTKILKALPFDQTIEGYGYEDLELAQRIHKANYSIIHTDNAVLHKGLKSTAQFIDDLNHALENLKILNDQGKIKESRLIRTYDFIKTIGLHQIVFTLLHQRIQYIKDKLYSPDPLLIFLDLYKLYYFDKMLKNRS